MSIANLGCDHISERNAIVDADARAIKTSVDVAWRKRRRIKMENSLSLAHTLRWRLILLHKFPSVDGSHPNADADASPHKSRNIRACAPSSPTLLTSHASLVWITLRLRLRRIFQFSTVWTGEGETEETGETLIHELQRYVLRPTDLDIVHEWNFALLKLNS